MAKISIIGNFRNLITAQPNSYCWLRDSYWVVKALNQLGSTATLSNYLKFLSNLVADICDLDSSEKRLQPVYGVSLETRLNEREMHRLAGYRAKGPVVLGTMVSKLAKCKFNDRIPKIFNTTFMVALSWL